MSWITFEHKGRTHRFAVARTGGGVWIGWPGRAKFFGPDEEEEASSREARTGEIRAPMTGRVVRVEGVPGAVVKKGQVLVVMEAMKMEYRLAAPRDGVVQGVHCKEGDSVDLGRKLVTLSKPS